MRQQTAQKQGMSKSLKENISEKCKSGKLRGLNPNQTAWNDTNPSNPITFMNVAFKAPHVGITS